VDLVICFSRLAKSVILIQFSPIWSLSWILPNFCSLLLYSIVVLLVRFLLLLEASFSIPYGFRLFDFLGFEPWTLHTLCIVLTNWAKLTGTSLFCLNLIFFLPWLLCCFSYIWYKTSNLFNWIDEQMTELSNEVIFCLFWEGPKSKNLQYYRGKLEIANITGLNIY